MVILWWQGEGVEQEQGLFLLINQHP